MMLTYKMTMDCVRALSFILLALGLGACENTLIYGERTGFNLAISVNDDPATPLTVNAGFERSVAGLVPPVETSKDSGGENQAVGEAVNMFSGFKLLYTEDKTSVFGGTLTIRTQFASGAAASLIAQGKEADKAVAQIVQMRGTFSDSESVERIRSWLKSDPGNLDLLKTWREENHPRVDLAQLRFAREFEAERQAAIEDLNIP